MNSDYIRYIRNVKYQLIDEYRYNTGIKGYCFETPLIRMEPCGLLIIFSRYAWDGPSGPTIDFKSMMRASLIHDALYQAMRLGFLPIAKRAVADKIFQRVCVEDGVPSMIAWSMYLILQECGEPNALPSAEEPPIKAP